LNASRERTVMADARAFTVCVLAATLLRLSVAAETPQAEPQRVVDPFGRGAYRPGGGKPALRLMRFVEPSAPNAAAATPAEPVTVEAIVRSSGSVGDARVVDPRVSPLVAREALRVVRGWAFRPPLLDGREVSVLATSQTVTLPAWFKATNAPLFNPHILDEVLKYVFIPADVVKAYRRLPSM